MRTLRQRLYAAFVRRKRRDQRTQAECDPCDAFSGTDDEREYGSQTPYAAPAHRTHGAILTPRAKQSP
jgi:hypothetical protein